MTNSDLPVLKFSTYALKDIGALSGKIAAEDNDGNIWGVGNDLEECKKDANMVLERLGDAFGSPSIVDMTFSRIEVVPACTLTTPPETVYHWNISDIESRTRMMANMDRVLACLQRTQATVPVKGSIGLPLQ